MVKLLLIHMLVQLDSQPPWYLTDVLCVPLPNWLKLCIVAFFLNPHIASTRSLPTGGWLDWVKWKGGLYLLQASSSSCAPAVSTISSFVPSVNMHNKTVHSAHSVAFDLWHYRLGHLAYSKLNAFCNKVPNIDCTNQLWMCPLAKQWRLPFPPSQHVSGSVFDLIHCEVLTMCLLSTVLDFFLP